MKLPERFRDSGAEEVLDPEVEAELRAIDSLLAGSGDPSADPALARLTRELRDERTEPDPDFAAQLDRWAADGFPRAQRPGAEPGTAERLGAAWERLGARARSIQPRRLVAPVGVAAITIMVVGVAVSQMDRGSDDEADSGAMQVEQGADQSGGNAAEPALPDEDATSDLNLDGESAGFTRESDRLGALSAPAAKDIRGRRVARDADLVLASDPEQIPKVADGVNEVVNTYRGFITRSSVQSGDSGRGGLGAQFRMKIPAKNLQPALADLSELAHVRSRTEGTEDITGRFISSQERIEEAEAARAGLIDRLANATTDVEAAAIRAQLRIVNSQLSSAREDLAGAKERVSLVPISVSVVAEEGASAPGDRDDEWGVDDALNDAGGVLSAVAGIAIIAGAVLLPLALVVLLVVLAWQAWTSFSRERALGRE